MVTRSLQIYVEIAVTLAAEILSMFPTDSGTRKFPALMVLVWCCHCNDVVCQTLFNWYHLLMVGLSCCSRKFTIGYCFPEMIQLFNLKEMPKQQKDTLDKGTLK